VSNERSVFLPPQPSKSDGNTGNPYSVIVSANLSRERSSFPRTQRSLSRPRRKLVARHAIAARQIIAAVVHWMDNIVNVYTFIRAGDTKFVLFALCRCPGDVFPHVFRIDRTESLAPVTDSFAFSVRHAISRSWLKSN